MWFLKVQWFMWSSQKVVAILAKNSLCELFCMILYVFMCYSRNRSSNSAYSSINFFLKNSNCRSWTRGLWPRVPAAFDLRLSSPKPCRCAQLEIFFSEIWIKSFFVILITEGNGINTKGTHLCFWAFENLRGLASSSFNHIWFWNGWFCKVFTAF